MQSVMQACSDMPLHINHTHESIYMGGNLQIVFYGQKGLRLTCNVCNSNSATWRMINIVSNTHFGSMCLNCVTRLLYIEQYARYNPYTLSLTIGDVIIKDHTLVIPYLSRNQYLGPLRYRLYTLITTGGVISIWMIGKIMIRCGCHDIAPLIAALYIEYYLEYDD